MLLKRYGVLTASYALFSIALALINPSNSWAHEDDRYIIGYVNHPRVITFYKPLIQRAYEDIGITPTFEAVGGERGLRLLDKGMTDADVIRYDVVSSNDNNILVVEPILSSGASYLLCVHNVECDKSIINDPNTTIAVTTRFFFNIEAKPSELAANLLVFDDFQHVITLLLNERYNYAILPSDNAEQDMFARAGIKYVPLFEHALVHVIHKKHAHLLDELSKSLTKQLAEANLSASSPQIKNAR